jgi:hypothetical protein
MLAAAEDNRMNSVRRLERLRHVHLLPPPCGGVEDIEIEFVARADQQLVQRSRYMSYDISIQPLHDLLLSLPIHTSRKEGLQASTVHRRVQCDRHKHQRTSRRCASIPPVQCRDGTSLYRWCETSARGRINGTLNSCHNRHVPRKSCQSICDTSQAPSLSRCASSHPRIASSLSVALSRSWHSTQHVPSP